MDNLEIKQEQYENKIKHLREDGHSVGLLRYANEDISDISGNIDTWCFPHLFCASPRKTEEMINNYLNRGIEKSITDIKSLVETIEFLVFVMDVPNISRLPKKPNDLNNSDDKKKFLEELFEIFRENGEQYVIYNEDSLKLGIPSLRTVRECVDESIKLDVAEFIEFNMFMNKISGEEICSGNERKLENKVVELAYASDRNMLEDNPKEKTIKLIELKDFIHSLVDDTENKEVKGMNCFK